VTGAACGCAYPRYAFDHAFDASVSTAEVYARTTKFMIQGVLDGFNATVFAYGQTGTSESDSQSKPPQIKKERKKKKKAR
jgi:kinesin family protein 18/19